MKFQRRNLVILKRIKEIIKLFLNVITPNYYIKFLKWRYFVVNDLSIQNVKEYQANSTFPTLYKFPPSKYKKWLNSRTYDENGIVMYEKEGNLYYNPVQISQYGLSEYGYYLSTKDEEHLKRAKKVVNWLVKNQEEKTGIWLYYFDFHVETSKETLKSPWVCGMAQGEAIALLSRMYALEKNEEYLAIAINAMKPLEIPVEEGGVKADIYGMPIYEEYPTKTYSHVLNGFMFCLVGLHDLYEISGNEKAKRLYEEGIQTLKQILPLYDSEYTSYYDLGHLTCPPHAPRTANKYDPIHVNLLQTLNIFEKNEVIEFYSLKWSHGILEKLRRSK